MFIIYFMIGEFSKILIVLGIVLILVGVGLPYLSKLEFLGKLPGDISYRGKNFSFYFPVVTCIILSVLLTVVLNLFFRK